MAESLNKTVLFVCTGNYFRSRLSEILFNHYAQARGLEWTAISRGLANPITWKGISDAAIKFLLFKELQEQAQNIRDPLAMKLEELEQAELVVVLNRQEHQSMMKMKFGLLAKMLEEKGKVRYWNVYDLPQNLSLFTRLFNADISNASQLEESSTEHIDFGIRALVDELMQAE
jgi:protein-tyrosine phosphatase